MDVGAPLVADRKPAEAVQPGQRALDDPSVPPQPFAGLHASSCDPGPDRSGTTLGPAAAMIVGLVGMQPLGSLAGSTLAVPHTGHRVQGCSQHDAVVPVGRAQTDPKRGASAVDHKVALRARFAAIRWVRAGLGTPLFAGTDALSRLARLQSR